jgi:hypothetical protein
MPPAAVMGLQRTAGNAAVGRVLARMGTPPVTPTPHHVFAAVQGSPAWPVCEDAAVRSDERGQAGWDLGVNFVSLEDLLGQLARRHLRSAITRLAISCHGQAPGEQGGLYLEDTAREHLVTAARLRGAMQDPSFATPADAELPGDRYDRPYFVRVLALLRSLREYLADDATVLFVSCAVASNDSGLDLLVLLTDILGARVVGFPFVLSRSDTSRRSEGGSLGCYVPGAQVTNTAIAPGTQAVGQQSLQMRGWASETHPSARIATPGGGLSSGEGDTIRADPYSGWGGSPSRSSLPPLAPLHFRPRQPAWNPRPGTRVRDPVTGRLRTVR